MKDLGVLVVVDGRAVLSVIERMFSHFKVRIDYAVSATEAFNRLITRDYRTMITDLDLPGMSGIELAREAMEHFPNLNVILFSGKTTEQIIHLALAPKVSDITEAHLKPCALGEMLKSIRNTEHGKIFLLEQVAIR